MGRKAVFFDIDGTIWDFQNRIPDSTIQAIRTLRANGHLAFLCSGRTRAFIRDPKLFEIGFDGVVSGCGTMIEYQDKVLFYKEVEPAVAEYTIRTVRKYGMRPILEGKEFLYLDENEFGQDPYGKKLKAEMGEKLLTIEKEWGRWQISKLSCATEDADQEGCYRTLAEYYEFIRHDVPVVELVPKGFHKGTGVQQTCDLLNISIQDTFAFGDSANDLSMLETAGTGIAMGNGTDRVKKAADYVTTAMTEDGIWNACRHFQLI